MSKNCPFSGECIRASICEGYDDKERIIDLISRSPEIQIMKDALSEDDLLGLMRPVLNAWNSESCYKARMQALKGLQFEDDISHVSMTMGFGVVEKLEETQLEI
ncbi:hypothetical protein KY385_04645 [Candidatus Parcubacteria bacterium]|nr:hypothetical protein [Candidatus Parcubacteria bacterium]